jgi:hypothetical protein
VTAVPAQPKRIDAGFLSSAAAFSLPVGQHIVPGKLHGYYVDLRVKAPEPAWPPANIDENHLHVHAVQWGLGCWERSIAGEGERWLDAALVAGDYLLRLQEKGGQLDGGLVHRHDYPHTFRLRPPWISALPQGELASLMLRLHSVTGRADFLDAGHRALRLISVPTADGGACARLGDGWLPEEYPTAPPSFVLNGAIFALLGMYDASLALPDQGHLERFEAAVGTLATNLHRWDTGSWSRYDLYPHPVPNIASGAYHALHITLLTALQMVAPRPEFAATRARFEGYAADPLKARVATVRKVLFRLVVPRNPSLSRRLPWMARIHR